MSWNWALKRPIGTEDWPLPQPLDVRALDIVENALDRVGDARTQYVTASCAGDEALETRVRELLLAEDRAEMNTGAGLEAAFGDRPPPRVGPYRITGRIAEGGMGTVWAGERDDGAFERRVAVKFVPVQSASENVLARFQTEQALLAQLQHPGIAVMLDGGTITGADSAGGTADRPYIVMEYVEGEPFAYDPDRALDDTLDAFTRVLAAVAHAHRNLVLHRDIKPGNILITQDGRPKLLDFGIAKLMAEAAGPGDNTGFGAVPVTPAYAAPERLAGDVATTASDIYSLGVLLYELTSGARPFDLAGLSLPEAHKRVTTETPPPAIGVPADIDMIARTAMHPDPVQRYATVEAMAADVRAFLRGHPIAARGDDWRYRARKLLARNKAASAIAASALVLLIGALAATLLALDRAQTARADADQRFADVRELANTLMSDVHDAVADVPGSTSAREVIASTAQGYLDRLARTENADVGLLVETGRGYLRLAEVQGGLDDGALGKGDAANESVRAGEAILEAAHARYPEAAEAQLALADLRLKQAARALYEDSDPEGALALVATARELYAGLGPEHSEARLGLVNSVRYQGDAYNWQNKFAESAERLTEGLRQFRALPNDIQAQKQGLAVQVNLLRQRGLSYSYLKQHDLAIADLRETVEVQKALMGADGETAKYRRGRAVALWSLASGLVTAEQSLPEAVSLYTEALDIAQELSRRDPEDRGAIYLLFAIYANRGGAFHAMENYAAAIEDRKTSLALRKTWAGMRDPDANGARNLMIAADELSDSYLAAGQIAAGCAMTREARGYVEDLRGYGGITPNDQAYTVKSVEENEARC
ncbi:serine/threonine protein kinase [Pacificimonas sp. WHA3]|uniref:Serine/threonine protein kinase n=1 Tax=Pacificimonas pallii TaxID=2827236 RepID=A0ABS6SCJ6_9SPHN|nr:serine/threonine-protein kinase [Pacificimonas pallii]MBV7255641.1 serine/threonine protein kinase [Pacificimonas pallii]